ncbi:MAG: MmcQ/YjbR family DNA-binding protein [Planctomycetales bacterium]|nr:MmcQ/YjbR family DNA-binding protein [Planctomycetales bacterium]
MARDEIIESKPMLAIRKIALRYPEVDEGSSCVNRAFKARGKSFLFLGGKPDVYTVRLKLADSLPEAESLAQQHPDNYSVGSHGWTLITLPHSKAAPAGLLERWIAESFRLLAPAALVASAPAAEQGSASPKAARKPVRKK